MNVEFTNDGINPPDFNFMRIVVARPRDNPLLSADFDNSKPLAPPNINKMTVLEDFAMPIGGNSLAGSEAVPGIVRVTKTFKVF